MSHKTTVRLLSWTANPIETIYAEWVQSRTQEPVPNPSELHLKIAHEKMDQKIAGVPPELEAKILDVFEKVVAMKMPLGESISFVFLLEHVPVALREQLVRHRIGHKFGDRLGADIIPDLAGGSSFWSQTTRIVDMGTFATDGEYLTPTWLEENGHADMPGYTKKDGQVVPDGESRIGFAGNRPGTIQEFYDKQMLWIQAAYRRLVKAGMPLEDARNILPVAMMHRMTWTTNLQALMHVLSRRSCWLAQLGMWEPVVHGIVEELANRIHPTFRRLIDPPCISADGNFQACAFVKENEEIAGNAAGIGRGEYPPCSLWVNREFLPKHTLHAGLLPNPEKAVAGTGRVPRYEKMMTKYEKLWARDPRTGERKVVA
jgi:thymidylate synthase ThyX